MKLSALILFLIAIILVIEADFIFVGITVLLLLILIILSKFKLLNPVFLYLFPLMALIYLGGDVFNFYKDIFEYDSLLHLVAAFSASLLIGDLVKKLFKKFAKNWRSVFIVVLTLGIVIGVGWELFEIWVEYMGIQNLAGDTTDTASDLVIDLVGTLAAGLVIKRKLK